MKTRPRVLPIRLPRYWGLGGLLLLTLSARAAAPAAVPPAQAQCFQLRFLLRLPGFESLHFIRQVETLRDLAPTDDAAGNQRVADLDRQAQSLRRGEARGFTQITALLKTMSAPPALRAWAAQRAGTLAQPPTLTPDERQAAKIDPATADILATLDEASSLKGDTDDHLSALTTWLTLTRGRSGQWAGALGELTAGLHVALAHQETLPLSPAAVRLLRDAAPAGTPAAVHDALGLLLPKAEGLSHIAPTPVAAQDIAQAEATLLGAFGAKGMDATDEQPK